MLPDRLKGYNKNNEFGSRGGYHHAGSAKAIRWTPLKIIIAALCVAIPYFTVVIVIASVASVGAAIPLIVIPLAVLLCSGLVYVIGLLGRAKPQRKKPSRRKR